jgi:hypothetical protein
VRAPRWAALSIPETRAGTHSVGAGCPAEMMLCAPRHGKSGYPRQVEITPGPGWVFSGTARSSFLAPNPLNPSGINGPRDYERCDPERIPILRGRLGWPSWNEGLRGSSKYQRLRVHQDWLRPVARFGANAGLAEVRCVTYVLIGR